MTVELGLKIFFFVLRLTTMFLMVPVIRKQWGECKAANGLKRYKQMLLILSVSTMISMASGFFWWIETDMSAPLGSAGTTIGGFGFALTMYLLYRDSR